MNSATNSTEDTSEKGCLTGLLLLLQNATGNLRGNQFDFYSFYNPENGDVKSYIYSLIEQDISIKETEKSFHFEKDECIWMELSKKYSLDGIEKLGADAGFQFKEHFLDSKGYFSDSLFTKG